VNAHNDNSPRMVKVDALTSSRLDILRRHLDLESDDETVELALEAFTCEPVSATTWCRPMDHARTMTPGRETMTHLLAIAANLGRDADQVVALAVYALIRMCGPRVSRTG